MKFRWICGNCGFDKVETSGLGYVPLKFFTHILKNDYACLRRDAFYVELIEEDETTLPTWQDVL